MSVAPHAGVIDFGTFISPEPGKDGVQGEVPAPLAAEAGYVLTTAGWGPVEALPPQTGEAGKYLTTDGTTASWQTVSAGVSSVNGQTGAVVLTAADVGAVQQSLVNILLTGF
jgi:hypothetical protein